jgi:hypothetical protein
MSFRITRSGAAVVLATCSVVIAGCASAIALGRPSTTVQLTGRQLSALLVPVSALPGRYKVEKNTVKDSGSRLETAAAKYHLAAMSCAAINDDNGRAGFGESAFAEAGDVDLSGLVGTGLLQQVYQFHTADSAVSFWRGLRAITIRCPGLGAAAIPDSGKVTQRVFAVRYGRNQAFEADMTQARSQSSSVNSTMLTVVEGDDVLTVGVVGYGRPVPTDLSARTLMNQLAARVQTAR